MPVTGCHGIANRSKAKSQNARKRGPTPPAFLEILYQDQFCSFLRPNRFLHRRRSTLRDWSEYARRFSIRQASGRKRCLYLAL